MFGEFTLFKHLAKKFVESIDQPKVYYVIARLSTCQTFLLYGMYICTYVHMNYYVCVFICKFYVCTIL